MALMSDGRVNFDKDQLWEDSNVWSLVDRMMNMPPHPPPSPKQSEKLEAPPNVCSNLVQAKPFSRFMRISVHDFALVNTSEHSCGLAARDRHAGRRLVTFEEVDAIR